MDDIRVCSSGIDHPFTLDDPVASFYRHHPRRRRPIRPRHLFHSDASHRNASLEPRTCSSRVSKICHTKVVWLQITVRGAPEHRMYIAILAVETDVVIRASWLKVNRRCHFTVLTNDAGSPR